MDDANMQSNRMMEKIQQKGESKGETKSLRWFNQDSHVHQQT